MIDQRRHGLDEPHGVGKRGVQFEGGFVDPARVDVEQPVIAGCGKGIDRETTGLGAGRRQYIAQSSPDPFGPTTWSPLGVSLGKTRVLTGASGTRIWVRFATVRGALQSDWCTPVLVTIP